MRNSLNSQDQQVVSTQRINLLSAGVERGSGLATVGESGKLEET